MSNVERKLYQKNKLGNIFVLIGIVLNIIYSIFILNNMDKDYNLGIFVFVTILFLLLGFLTGIKLETYSKGFSFVAVAIGIVQFSRTFIGTYLLEPNQLTLLNIALILSGINFIIGGLITLRYSIQREAYMKNH